MEENRLQKYFEEMGSRQLLSEEQECELSAKVLKGDERAKNRLVEANLRLVAYVAREYQGKGLAMDDLISEGNMGLIKAAGKFDASRGLRFAGYAAVYGRNSLPWHERLALDVEYVRKQSFLLDVKVFLKTFVAVLRQKGIYNESGAQ